MCQHRRVFVWLMVDQRIASMKRTNTFVIIDQSGPNDSGAYAPIFFWIS